MDAKTDKAPKKKQPETQDEKLDDALDDTFPASDPPAAIEPHAHIGGTPDRKKDTGRHPAG
jgi:hypothetical protein